MRMTYLLRIWIWWHHKPYHEEPTTNPFRMCAVWLVPVYTVLSQPFSKLLFIDLAQFDGMQCDMVWCIQHSSMAQHLLIYIKTPATIVGAVHERGWASARLEVERSNDSVIIRICVVLDEVNTFVWHLFDNRSKLNESLCEFNLNLLAIDSGKMRRTFGGNFEQNCMNGNVTQLFLFEMCNNLQNRMINILNTIEEMKAEVESFDVWIYW